MSEPEWTGWPGAERGPSGPGKVTETTEQPLASSMALELRERLRDHAVVVLPGETLVVLGDPRWTPHQLQGLQYQADAIRKELGLTFQVLFVPGAQLATARVLIAEHKADHAWEWEWMPLVTFSYVFRCRNCLWTVQVPWSEQTANLSVTQVGEAFEKQFGGRVTGSAPAARSGIKSP